LLDLWPLLTAARVRVRDATAGVKGVLGSLTRQKLFDQRTLPSLAFFALVQP